MIRGYAMSNAEMLYEKLKEAIASGDPDAILDAKNNLLLAGRDKEIDRSLINSVKDKTLGKSLRKIIKEEDIDRLFCMKTISSLITHIIIEADLQKRDLDDYSIKELYVILGGFVNDKDEAVQNAKKFITDRYSEFM